MAQEASITQATLKFAEAIHKYAESKGWKPNDYHIFMTVNTGLIVLRIHVVARAFDGRTEEQEYNDYDDVMDFIEAEVGTEQRIFNSYSLVLSGMENFAFFPSARLETGDFAYFAPTRLGTGDVEIDEKLINRGVSWSEPFRSEVR
jgi:hypothetical protein